MVDLSFGPEPGQRLNPLDRTGAYLILTRRRRLYSLLMLGIVAALLVGGFPLAQERNAGGFLRGLPHLFDFPAEILSEAWAARDAVPGLMAEHFPALIETLNIAAVATLIGALCAGVLAPLSTRGLARFPALIPVFRRSLDIFRAVPDVVIALVLIFVMGGGPIPAVIAIAFHTTGALGKLFSEVAENADLKPIEGLTSVGASWTQRMAFGLLPQVAPNWLSYALMRFEINVRASAILGFVGQGGIGYDLKIALQWGQGRYDQVVAIFLLLFLTIVAIDRLSDHLRRRLTEGA
jgi:phosphonate transport system permease protein